MSILVTGGAGFIGSHAIVELLNEGHSVVAIDNLSNSKNIAIKRIQDITGKAFEFVEGDIRDAQLLKDFFSKHSIDSVMHFAGLKAVGETLLIRLPITTIILLEACVFIKRWKKLRSST